MFWYKSYLFKFTLSTHFTSRSKWLFPMATLVQLPAPRTLEVEPSEAWPVILLIKFTLMLKGKQESKGINKKYNIDTKLLIHEILKNYNDLSLFVEVLNWPKGRCFEIDWPVGMDLLLLKIICNCAAIIYDRCVRSVGRCADKI